MNKKIFWVYIISALVYACQGLEGLPGLSLSLYLKEHLGLTADKLMYIGSITTLAWIFKPVIGYFIDNFLTKKKWIIISLLGSIIISLYFGFTAFIPLGVLMVLMAVANTNSAVRDISADGIMCVEGKKENECDTIQSWQWGSLTIATIITGLLGGYVAQHFSYKIAYLLLIPLYIVVWFVMSKYKKSRPARKYISTISCIKSYKELLFNKRFLLVCLFLFLYKYSPSFGTPLFYIQRDNWHWSAQWIGILESIGAVFSLLGAIVFYKYCKKLNLKRWLTISVWIGAFSSLAYLYYKPYTCVIYNIVFAFIGMVIFLLSMSFMAKSTINGKEATSFALLCGIANLAGTASGLSGAFLLPKVGLNTLILLSALTSFLCLPLIPHIFKED